MGGLPSTIALNLPASATAQRGGGSPGGGGPAGGRGSPGGGSTLAAGSAVAAAPTVGAAVGALVGAAAAATAEGTAVRPPIACGALVRAGAAADAGTAVAALRASFGVRRTSKNTASASTSANTPTAGQTQRAVRGGEARGRRPARSSPACAAPIIAGRCGTAAARVGRSPSAGATITPAFDGAPARCAGWPAGAVPADVSTVRIAVALPGRSFGFSAMACANTALTVAGTCALNSRAGNNGSGLPLNTAVARVSASAGATLVIR